MPFDHQAYDYCDADIGFNMISKDLSNRVEYHDIYYLHAVLVGGSFTRTLVNDDHLNDLENHSSMKICLLTMEQTHSTLVN